MSIVNLLLFSAILNFSVSTTGTLRWMSAATFAWGSSILVVTVTS